MVPAILTHSGQLFAVRTILRLSSAALGGRGNDSLGIGFRAIGFGWLCAFSGLLESLSVDFYLFLLLR